MADAENDAESPVGLTVDVSDRSQIDAGVAEVREALGAATILVTLLFVTKMLQGSEALAVIATDVARYYAQHGMVAILPIALPCKMDAFGLITRTDRLLSPAAKVMLRAIKSAALTVYGAELDLTGLE